MTRKLTRIAEMVATMPTYCHKRVQIRNPTGDAIASLDFYWMTGKAWDRREGREGWDVITLGPFVAAIKLSL